MSAPTKEIAKASPQTATIAQNFVAKIEKQFQGELGQGVNWTTLEQRLAQHLYIKIDGALKALEGKRASNNFKKDDPPITWDNVNMAKLATDAVHRVNLALDALIANHIHVVPYLNKLTKKYDVDLQIGYVGEDHCHRRFAKDEILDIRYQLVHETDTFNYGSTPEGIAWYKYDQTSPFSPGEVIGGFGYISYADPRKNRVVIVEYREFEKAEKASRGVEFWGGIQTEWVKDEATGRNKKVDGQYDEKFRKEMMYKTVVRRVTAKIALDPIKVNTPSWNAVQESRMDAIDAAITAEAEEIGNGQVLELPVQEAQAANAKAAKEPELVLNEAGHVTDAPKEALPF